MRQTTLSLLLLATLLGLHGCSSDCKAKQPGYGIAVTPHHEHTLQNYQLGRVYMGQGRYELAKERLLLALTSARDPEMRARLADELRAVDMMIQTQR